MVFSLLVLAVASFILTAPAYAADDNTVSIAVDQNATLRLDGKLRSGRYGYYKATADIIIKTNSKDGFNLTMQSDGNTADLINTSNSNARIKGMGVNKRSIEFIPLNSWGYLYSEYDLCAGSGRCEYDEYGEPLDSCQPKMCATHHIYSGVPASNEPAAIIVDKEPDKAGDVYNKSGEYKNKVTFEADLDLATLPQGTYSTNIIYTATAKPKLAPTVNLTICRSGDFENDCQVDLDPNMIPVKYTGSTINAQWTSLANPEDSYSIGEWYNYNNKQWANALTVKDPSKYKNQTRVVDQADILGFWVYIPRYAYEVMRKEPTDNPVPEQDFLIEFEKAYTPKRHPASCSEQGRDYRTQCDLDRSYIKGYPSNTGTWSTHPAFTFGTKELNGIWFAKFETTGTNTQPTVLPNERHIEGYYSNLYIGGFYTVAKSLGVNDPQNVGGNSVSTTQNNHHLTKLSSRMVNNNDWGAATYLSASKYGAGYNGVQINANGANHNSSYGTTGCGPQANGNTSDYSDSGTLGTPQACGNADRAYNGTLGQLASTTNNPTGIYDMSGGGWEYVAASYGSNLNNSNTSYFNQCAHPPYVNTYNFKDFNSCTYQTCGGQALYETNNGGSTSGTQWNGNYSYFVYSSYPWFVRGGYYVGGSNAGLFYAIFDGGFAHNYHAFRVALAPLQD